jgi:hypothetical protein
VRVIDQPCSFRVIDRADQQLQAPGAIGSAIARLRAKPASAREIAGWPGMNGERASRLLNALYLTSNLMVLRVPAVGAVG